MEGSQETMAAEMETVGVKFLSNMGADADFWNLLTISGCAFVTIQRALTINDTSLSSPATLKALKNMAESIRASDSMDEVCILDKWDSSDISFNHVFIAAHDDMMVVKVSAMELNREYGW